MSRNDLGRLLVSAVAGAITGYITAGVWFAVVMTIVSVIWTITFRRLRARRRP